MSATTATPSPCSITNLMTTYVLSEVGPRLQQTAWRASPTLAQCVSEVVIRGGTVPFCGRALQDEGGVDGWMEEASTPSVLYEQFPVDTDLVKIKMKPFRANRFAYNVPEASVSDIIFTVDCLALAHMTATGTIDNFNTTNPITTRITSPSQSSSSTSPSSSGGLQMSLYDHALSKLYPTVILIRNGWAVTELSNNFMASLCNLNHIGAYEDGDDMYVKPPPPLPYWGPGSALQPLQSSSSVSAKNDDDINILHPQQKRGLHPHRSFPTHTPIFVNVTTVGDQFLCHLNGVEELDLEDLFGTCGNLVNIGDGFIPAAAKLKRIRLGAALRGLRAMPRSMFSGNINMEHVDWDTAIFDHPITEIGRGFCYNSAFTSFTFPESFSNVSDIGGQFLGAGRLLTSVDMHRCRASITTIGDGFLERSLSLTDLYITSPPTSGGRRGGDGFPGSLPSLAHLGERALNGCTCLSFDVVLRGGEGMVNGRCHPFVHALPTSVFRGSGLRSVILDGTPSCADGGGGPCTTLTEICDHALADAPRLHTIHLIHLPNLAGIHRFVAQCCIHLTDVKLCGLPSLIQLDGGFLERCEALETVDFRGIGCDGLTEIGARFMSGCVRLRSILGINELLLHVLAIKGGFLSNCTSLASLDLSPTFGGVRRLGSHFMAGCTALEEVSLFDGGVGLTDIPSNFLDGCRALKLINHSGRTNKDVPNCIVPPDAGFCGGVGPWFMKNCSSLEALDVSGLVCGQGSGPAGDGFLAGCAAMSRLTYCPRTTAFHHPIELGEYAFNKCTRLLSLLQLSSSTPLQEVVCTHQQHNPTGGGAGGAHVGCGGDVVIPALFVPALQAEYDCQPKH